MSHENGNTGSADRRQHVAVEAGEWLLRLRRGDLSKEERGQFVDWLREAPVHVTEMLRVSQVDAVLRGFDGWQDILPLDPREASSVVPLESQQSSSVATLNVGRQREAQRPTRPRIRWRLPTAIAAGLSALALALWTMGALGWERVETGAAERRELALADGSVVQIAPDSRLRIHLERRMRHVVLSRGEAFFRVARDGRPFIVETDYATVRVTGTAFAVQRESEAVVVTVAEGKVVVQNAEGATGAQPATGVQGAVAAGITLTAGEQVTAPRRGPMGAIRSVDAARELSWTIGHLIFDRDSVFDAANRFNRYNKTQLRISDNALGERRISGVFDSVDPQSFVSFLESVFAARVEHPSADEIVVGSPAGLPPANR